MTPTIHTMFTTLIACLNPRVHATREGFLEFAATMLAPIVSEAYGLPLDPKTLKLSCGFPSKGALAQRKRSVGECWPAAAGDGLTHILISPLVKTPTDVLAILLHEMIHAADANVNGHKGPFTRACRAIGLDGKPTSTYPSDALSGLLQALGEAFGEYPHPGLTAGGKGHTPQSTRMLKIVCPSCGLIVRAARKSIEDKGLPTHCDEEMQFETKEEDDQ